MVILIIPRGLTLHFADPFCRIIYELSIWYVAVIIQYMYLAPFTQMDGRHVLIVINTSEQPMVYIRCSCGFRMIGDLANFEITFIGIDERLYWPIRIAQS